MKRLFKIILVGFLCLFSVFCFETLEAQNAINKKWRYEQDQKVNYYIQTNEKHIVIQGKTSFKELWGYGDVYDIQYSPNNQWLAVASSIGVELYHRQRHQLTKHLITKGKVLTIDFSPDNKYLGIGLEGGQLLLWQLSNYAVQFVNQEETTISKLRFSTDSKNMVVALKNGYIVVRDFEGYAIRNYKHKGRIIDLTIKGESIYAGGEGQALITYDSRNRYGSKILAHQNWINSLDSTDQTLVSAGFDKQIQIYSFSSGKINNLSIHHSPVVKAVIDTNQNRVISVDVDGTIKSSNLENLKTVTLFQAPSTVKNMMLAPDGREICLVLANNTLYRLFPDKNFVRVMKNHLPAIFSADSLENRTLVMTGHDDGTVVFWRRQKNLSVITKKHSNWINTISISKENKYAFTGDGSGKVIRWHLQTYKAEKEYKFAQPVLGISPHSDKELIVITPFTAYRLDINTGNKTAIANFKKRILAFSHNKKQKLLGLSLSTGEILIITPQGKIIKRVPNKKRVASMKWGLEKDKLLLTYEDNSSVLQSLNKPFKQKEVGDLKSGSVDFYAEDSKKTTLLWSPKDVLVVVKKKDEVDKKIARIKSLGEKEKKDIVAELEKKLNDKSIPPKRKVRMHLQLAQLYSSEGSYEKSLANYQKALLYYIQAGEKEKVWRIYNNMGVIMIFQRNYKQAIKTFSLGLELKKDQPILLYNVGLTYRKMKNPQKVLEYYTRALNGARTGKNSLAESHALYALARYYYRQKNYKKAKTFTQYSLALAKKIKHLSLIKKCLRFEKRFKK